MNGCSHKLQLAPKNPGSQEQRSGPVHSPDPEQLFTPSQFTAKVNIKIELIILYSKILRRKRRLKNWKRLVKIKLKHNLQNENV